MNEDPPTGKRFSHVYLQRGSPGKDSRRMRVRLAANFYELNYRAHLDLADLVHKELGARVPNSVAGYDYSEFIEKCELRDLLDFITLVWQELGRRQYSGAQREWLNFVNRVFEEENIGFRADARAGVHYYVDEEFEHNRVSVIGGLHAPRYAAVLAELNSSIDALDRTPSDGAAAIRCVFHALEIAFKLLCEQVGRSRVSRLGSKEVNNVLIPALDQIYPPESTALKSARQLASSFAKWVDSAHVYRHGQKNEEPDPPPMDMTVAMVSTGMSMLRWLAGIDQQLRTK